MERLCFSLVEESRQDIVMPQSKLYSSSANKQFVQG